MATHDPAHRSTPEPAIPRDRPESESPAIDVLFRDEAEFEMARPRHPRTVPARERMIGIEVVPILPSDQADAAAFPDEVDFLEERSPARVPHTPQLADSYPAGSLADAADRYTATPRAGVGHARRKHFSAATIAAIGVVVVWLLLAAYFTKRM